MSKNSFKAAMKGDGKYLVITPLVILLPVCYWYITLPPVDYCEVQGRVLSDKEKIEKVVVAVLNDYPKVFHREKWQGKASSGELSDGQWIIPPGKGDESWKSQIMSRPSYPIYYKNVQEFFELNPNCCIVTQSYRSIYHDGGGLVSSWERLTGRESAIVVVMWLLRYIDIKGASQTEVLERYEAMDNCGNFVDED